jgi:hypothetical protein
MTDIAANKLSDIEAPRYRRHTSRRIGAKYRTENARRWRAETQALGGGGCGSSISPKRPRKTNKNIKRVRALIKRNSLSKNISLSK